LIGASGLAEPLGFLSSLRVALSRFSANRAVSDFGFGLSMCQNGFVSGAVPAGTGNNG